MRLIELEGVTAPFAVTPISGSRERVVAGYSHNDPEVTGEYQFPGMICVVFEDNDWLFLFELLNNWELKKDEV